MRVWFAAWMAIVGGLLAGCQARQAGPSPQQPSPPQRPSPQRAATAPAHIDKSKQYILFVQWRIVTFEVPVGMASSSERIWSYLDEESLGVQQGASLARNGIRMGIGRRGDWPDIARALQQMTGRQVRDSTMTAIPGQPTFIELKTRQPEGTVFTFYDDRTLSGADYPPGDDLLTFVCTLDENDPTVVHLAALPQIRSTARKPQVVKDGRQILIAEKPALFSLEAMAFRASVPNKDFLVIGPNSESRRPWSVGRLFFVQDRDGMPFETVQLMIPEVLAAPVRQRAPEEPPPATQP